jgi:hypothetical protein
MRSMGSPRNILKNDYVTYAAVRNEETWQKRAFKQGRGIHADLMVSQIHLEEDIGNAITE